MSDLEILLSDRLKSERTFRLRSLSEALKQQLQETEKRQIEELERRIHHNSLLSSTDVDRQSKQTGLRRANSTLALTFDEGRSDHHRLNSAAPARASLTNWKHQSDWTTTRPQTSTEQCDRAVLSKTTQQSKEEEADAECRNKFRAPPVPSHVSLPLYKKIVEKREKERRQGHERRKNFLLSVQKPFSFQEREEKKKEKLTAMINQVSQSQISRTTSVKSSPHQGEKATDRVVSRKVHISTAQYDNPTSRSKPRTAECTKRKMLGFLDQKPSFQPQIIHQVPDFSKLHKSLQAEAMSRTQSKDVTKFQPFYLRTSARPARQSKMSPENAQVSQLRRSKSFGALTSLSPHTLPTFITDAVRKRCLAIRISMEMRDSKNRESTEWFKKHQTKSQSMKKKVALHAKLLDPHKSLQEEYDDKLRHHREADQQRMREYTRELRDMKARVNERPFLFEQVKLRNTKAQAERTYRNMLRKAGVKEEFVEETGAMFRPEDETAVNAHSYENVRHAKEENVDDGEKIEDVEEKSVKSKGEEML